MKEFTGLVQSEYSIMTVAQILTWVMIASQPCVTCIFRSFVYAQVVMILVHDF